MIAFLAAAVALTLVAAALVVVPLFRDRSAQAPVAAVLAALAIPAATMLLYAAISTYPWPAPGAGNRPVADTPAINALEERAQETPDDAEALANLGDAYLADERFAEARDAYREAVRLSGSSNNDFRLAFAEASILTDRQALMGEAGAIIEEVLSVDPVNAKALWYGGMAALGRGDAATARSRWSKLLELSPPPQVRQILEQQLASLDGGSPQRPSGTVPPSTAARIPVRIAVKAELAARIQKGAALFLIARAPGGAGPPLAVVRREGVTLPVDVEISDTDSMVPGRSITGLPRIQLTARMANDGEALAAPGDVFGEAVWSPDEPAATPLQIVMDQVVP